MSGIYPSKEGGKCILGIRNSLCKGPVVGEGNIVGIQDQYKVGAEYGIREAVRYQIVPSPIVCIKDFCCYHNKSGKPLGVCIRGHHHICLKKESLWLQCDHG